MTAALAAGILLAGPLIVLANRAKSRWRRGTDSDGRSYALDTPDQGTPRIMVEWSERVSIDASDDMHVETWLAVNPGDSTHFVATAMVPDRRSSVIYVSRDGGRRWVRSTDERTGARDFPSFDPVVEFGPDGTPYFSTLAEGFTVWRGVDGGSSWSRVGIVPGGTYDRQWLGFDSSQGPRHGRMYTAGKVPIQVLGSPARDVVAFSFSDDCGLVFRQPRLVLPNPEEGALNVLSHMIVLGDGRLAAAYQFFPWSQTEREGLIEGEMRVLLSPDGQSWEGQFGAGTLRVYGNRGDESLMVKSLGGGRLAAPPEAGSALHLVWVNETEGFLQVVLATSADGGRSWREPVLVNDGGRGSNHSNPAIAMNGAGHVAVMWNDRRDDPSDRCLKP